MIKDNIKKRIISTKFESNKSLFAREVGVNRDEIVRILSGKIQNPGVHTIAKIAKTLGCSIDELVGGSVPSHTLYSSAYPFKEELFLRTLDHVLNHIKHNNLCDHVTSGKIISAVDSIYSFSYKNKLSAPDEDFANWTCENLQNG